MVGIFPAPRAAFNFQELAKGRFLESIDVDKKFCVLVAYQVA
jgi:hypothetical protein